MSMLTLNGTVANIYESPVRKSKDGETFGGQHRIQLMCNNTLQNGERRIELIDLTVEDTKPYESFGSAPIRVPVGVYVRGSAPAYYVIKGALPEAV